MSRSAFLLIVTLFAAAGCTRSGGSETKAPEAAPPSPPAAPAGSLAKPDSRPVIAAFGDSLSEGYGAEPGKSYPDFLQRSLDEAGYRYRVANMGISGDTTTGGLGRIRTVIELQPEVVILELGGNDGLRGIPVSATRGNLEQMIRQLQAAGVKKIVLAGMSLPPNYGGQYIRGFESTYKELAAKYKLTLIPFLLEDIVPQLAKTPGLIQQDGIHPTAAGNRIVAATVLRYLKPVLRRA